MLLRVVNLHHSVVARGVDRVGHHLASSLVLMGPRASYVLVVVVLQVFLGDGALRHNGVLQVIHHLVLGSGLNLERADSSRLLPKRTVKLLFLLFKVLNPFHIGLILLPDHIQLLLH